MSDYRSITAGVPQGSILGPMIFLVYINDIIEEINTNIRLYADDSSLFLEYQDPDNAAALLSDDLRKVEKWASKWFVTFNPTKTESTTFSRKRTIVIPPLQMQDVVISNLQEHKHLGLI